MFTHIEHNIELESLENTKIDGYRYYKVGNDLFPSVTTILSFQKNQRLVEWRQSIGEEVANFESRRAANRGNGFHKICENYLKNNDISTYKRKVLAFGLFNLVKKEIDRIDNIYEIEATLYSKRLKIAGRTDCIAEFDGLLSIIDFKSANRAKPDDLLETHSIQETAYAIMWEELTNIPIEQIVTIITCENGDSQTIIRKPAFFIRQLEERVREFRIYEKSTIKIPNEKF